LKNEIDAERQGAREEYMRKEEVIVSEYENKVRVLDQENRMLLE
jgi:hypothetical protein